MQKCNRCNTLKPFSEFYKDKAFKDGHASQCKECKNKKTSLWREKNREKYNSDMRAYGKKHSRRIGIMQYGMTLDDLNQMLINQNHSCKLCNKKPDGKRPLAIDHCHSTGRVRGLLCYGCNRLMVAIDDKEFLKKALEYSK